MLAWLSGHEGPLAYAVFGIASMLEYLVPPLPGDAIALFGIFLTVSAGWSTAAVYAALNVGSVTGGMIAYAAGRTLKDRERRPRFLRGPRATRAIATLTERYQKHGAIYIAINRFVPAFRAFFFVAAGMAGLPAPRVAFFGLLSALVWNAILLGLGHVLGASYEQLASGVGVYGVVVVVLVAVGLVVAWRLGSRRFLRATAAAPGTTTPEAEAPGVDAARSDEP
jgi:membrane protein DedA with SNARE-associated domain